MYLGIDIGTSSVKALLVDEAGEVAGQAHAPLPISRPRPGWSEQHPDDWWEATGLAVTALDAAGRRAVRSIGLSGQMHGATLLDAADASASPGHPVERRPQRDRVRSSSRRRNRRAAASPATSRCQASPRRSCCGCAKHEPDLFARVRTVLLPKDYGAAAHDRRQGLRPVRCRRHAVAGCRRARAGRRAMLAATGPDRVAHAAAARRPGADRHGCAPRSRERWGLARVPVVAGGGDNAAGAVGVGVVAAGDAFLSLGTSGVTVRRRRRRSCPNPEPRGARLLSRPARRAGTRWRSCCRRPAASTGPRRLTGAADAAALLAQVEAPRPARRPGDVPAVPVGRAYAAQRPAGAWRAVRADARQRRGGDRSGGPRGRRLRVRRWTGRAASRPARRSGRSR